MNVYEGSMRKNITSTNATIIAPNGAIAAGGLALLGIFVSQASSTPTLKVADTAGTIANTFTPVAGTFYPLPCQISGTLTATLSGTVDATIFYGPT
jgi:hypothetical protein